MKKILYSVFALAIAAFTFTSCEDVPAPYDDPNDNPSDQPIVIEPSGDGTAASPYNVARILELAGTLESGESLPNQVYITGKVVEITENYNDGYGNATFYIADDEDSNTRFYVYRANYFNNERYSSGSILEFGDSVVVYGAVTNYNGTIETAQNNAYLVYLNGETGEGGGDEPSAGEPEGDGTEANPFNAIAAYQYVMNLEDNESTEESFYIKGIVSRIRSNYGEGDYPQNANYYISVDGTYDSEDSGNQFYIYASNYLNNEAYTLGDVLSEGDEVVVCGKLTKFVNSYGTTPETLRSESYLYDWTKGEGGGDEPGDEPGTSGEGLATITKSGTTITMVDPDVTATGETVTYDLNEFTSESSPTATTVTMADGTTIAFSQEDGNNPPIFHSGTRGVRMYARNSMTITPIKKIAKIVLQCDSYQGTDYIGNPQMYTEINGNVWKTVNDWTTNSGGTQLRIQTLTVTFAE